MMRCGKEAKLRRLLGQVVDLGLLPHKNTGSQINQASIIDEFLNKKKNGFFIGTIHV